LYFRPGDTGS